MSLRIEDWLAEGGAVSWQEMADLIASDWQHRRLCLLLARYRDQKKRAPRLPTGEGGIAARPGPKITGPVLARERKKEGQKAGGKIRQGKQLAGPVPPSYKGRTRERVGRVR